MEKGTSIPYSLSNLQERGKFFIPANADIYEGQVIGENTRAGDLVINITKTKKLSNMRSSGADDKVKIAPPITGAAKDGSSHESPIFGVPSCNLQTTNIPAMAAKNPEITCAVMTTFDEDIPINSAD